MRRIEGGISDFGGSGKTEEQIQGLGIISHGGMEWTESGRGRK